MHAHYFQHVPFEGLGSIEPWLQTAGHTITRTQFFAAGIMPPMDEIDFLIIMGGPMSVNDEADFPWLTREKQFLYDFIQTGKPVLGICLGAQLIASAMGARIYPNPLKEIGWFPIQGVAADDSGVIFPSSTKVFHWHGETFDLPPGAHRIARSEACDNQAFQMGNSVIGLQFHLETTPESARKIIAHCREELISSDYVQTEEKILSAPPEWYERINGLMGEILNFLEKNKK